ncbi:uncharacterized protein K02A2.6-like [Monomorium pharaonis]|uniref:uncharacterized protein K02A2.6-like n=1 Tax=Monomorium pharaonis TaxID=307658 RepID=UPI00063F4CB4|nr:uncharacterized protein K02A2.6-like [Monomorium pharaonis]
MQGGKICSKIDLKEAYAQVPVSTESKKYLTISTHKGLFEPHKLPCGIASAPGFFQKQMEQILSGISNVYIFLDDIVIKGVNDEDNLKTTGKVFDVLSECELKLRKEKCCLLKEKIRYLGVEIDAEGIHVLKDRVEAIDRAPHPKNIKKLQAFLGTINYYGKFVRDRSTKLQPLHACLQKNRFEWIEDCQKAFEQAKKDLKLAEVLINYDPKKELILTCDASDYGLFAVLSHPTPDGYRPIAFASKTLLASEKKYAPIDKKARAIIFGVRKYYDYLYGRDFILRTDNQPLARILGSKRGIPIMAARRLQSYVIFLSAFRFRVEYVPLTKNVADGFSRLPMPEKKTKENKAEMTYLKYVVDQNFVCFDYKQIARETRRDKELTQTTKYIMLGWPHRKNIPDHLQKYEIRKDELTIEENCLMWGYHVIIPKKLQEEVLSELHATHVGIVRIKSIARSFFWWPRIDQDIERRARSCKECAETRDAPPKSLARV